MPLPHAPWQRYLEESPRISVNVEGGLDEYRRVMCLKKKRERRIGVAEFRNVPMTSKSHPQGGLTYHVIRLEHPDPDRTDIAELLICDQNQYLLAYRRLVGNVWSEWFYFNDQKENMPKDVAMTPLSFGGAHSKRTPTTMPIGEVSALTDMYFVLTHPAPTQAALKRVLRRAILLFCEATRISSVLEDMEARMISDVHGEALSGLLWTRIRRWQKMSNYGLYRRKKVLVVGGDGVQEIVPPPTEQDEKEAELLEQVAPCQIYNLDQAIGPNGQLKLILFSDDYYQQYGNPPQFPDNYEDNFRDALV